MFRSFPIILLLAAASASQAQTLTNLVTFDGTNGSKPNSLIQGIDGNFYGATLNLIFKMTPEGALTTLSSEPVGSNPLIQASNGNFYGTTFSGGPDNAGTVFKLSLAGTFATVYAFQDVQLNTPTSPAAGLIQATDGNFYGTTNLGGGGYGAVFKITPNGTITTLHNFQFSDGVNPVAVLIQASDGNFYGTTPYGGAGSCTADYTANGCGTIFRITPDGALTTLYSFGVTSAASATPADGAYPMASLIQGGDGEFYGTTLTGGIAGCQGNQTFVVTVLNGCGTIFKFTPDGVLTTLYAFGATPGDGASPLAGLIQASDGNFYGTTSAGGTGGCQNSPGDSGPIIGCGTIFRITSAGSFTTLYSFGADYQPTTGISSDGASPQAPLVQANDGSFYGTTSGITTFQCHMAGKASNGCGTVFKISLTPPDTPAIAPSGGLLNGASFQPGISANAWITIHGSNLSSKTDTWNNSIVNGALPTTLDGVSVSVGGVPAYIEYVSATQINAIVPNVSAGSVPVTVTTANGTSQAAVAQLQSEQPAFFQWGTYAVATRQDFSLAVKNGTFPGTTTVPAKPGDVIILWGTGFGPTSPSAPAGMETPSTATYNTATAVSVTVGGKAATIYGAALAPGYAGLYQVAIQIPAGLSGDYPVVATINGVQSPSTTLITVQQ